MQHPFEFSSLKYPSRLIRSAVSRFEAPLVTVFKIISNRRFFALNISSYVARKRVCQDEFARVLRDVYSSFTIFELLITCLFTNVYPRGKIVDQRKRRNRWTDAEGADVLIDCAAGVTRREFLLTGRRAQGRAGRISRASSPSKKGRKRRTQRIVDQLLVRLLLDRLEPDSSPLASSSFFPSAPVFCRKFSRRLFGRHGACCETQERNFFDV